MTKTLKLIVVVWVCLCPEVGATTQTSQIKSVLFSFGHQVVLQPQSTRRQVSKNDSVEETEHILYV